MHKKNKGFTLIEIIVSIVVISIAFYTLISTMGGVTLRNVDSQQLLKAAFLAEQVMEEFTMEGKDWNTQLVSQETQSFTGDFSVFSYKVDVHYVDLTDLDGTAATPPTDYKRVVVTVTGEALQSPAVLTTLKVKYNQ